MAEVKISLLAWQCVLQKYSTLNQEMQPSENAPFHRTYPSYQSSSETIGSVCTFFSQVCSCENNYLYQCIVYIGSTRLLKKMHLGFSYSYIRTQVRMRRCIRTYYKNTYIHTYCKQFITVPNVGCNEGQGRCSTSMNKNCKQITSQVNYPPACT